MQKKYCYVFSDEDYARLFHNAVDHGGFEVERVGNAVMTDERVFAIILYHHEVSRDEYPIWMNDHL